MQFDFGSTLTALPTGDVWAVGTTDGGSSNAGAYVQHLCPIPVTDGGARPASTTSPRSAARSVSTKTVLGGGVAWKFSRHNRSKHQVVDASGMMLFDSGLRSRGGSYTRVFKSAGSFGWNDPIGHGKGIVRVPMRVRTSAGSKPTVRWTLGKTREGLVFDVQVKRPGTKRFVDWRTGVVTASAVFAPSRKGSYYFRARIRSVSVGRHSGWSPPVSFKW